MKPALPRFDLTAGRAKIAIRDNLIEYGGKWFEIPRRIEYQIFPETDTVMLIIQKPTAAFIEKNQDNFWRKDS